MTAKSKGRLGARLRSVPSKKTTTTRTSKPATARKRADGGKGAGEGEKRPQSGPRTTGRFQRALDRAARAEIRAALEETGGNVTHAARRLGLSQPSLVRRMVSLRVSARRYRR